MTSDAPILTRVLLYGGLTLAAAGLSGTIAFSHPAQTSAGANRVSGQVIDAPAQGHAIRRAIVTISGASLPAGRSAVTDDDGRFSFDRVPAGEYTIAAARPGFIKTAYGATRSGRPGTPVTVGTGAPLTDLTIVMPHGSALGGVLRDVVGDPAAGMRVEAIRIVQSASGDRGENAGASMTDDRGEYRLFDLPAGDYVLVATPAIIVGGMGDIGAPTDAEVDAIFASLPRRGGPAGPPAPVPGGAPASTVPPPTKGYSTPPTYYPGVLQSGDATRVTLGTSESREGLDFAVRLSHSASVDGAIVPMRGQALPQLLVRIRGNGPELPIFGGSGSGPSVRVEPATRTFHIGNVPPGHYRIVGRTLGGPGNSTQMISSGGALPSIDANAPIQYAIADVDVTGDDVTGVTLTLQLAPRVTGRLVSDGSSSRPIDASAARLTLDPLTEADDTNGLSSQLAATMRPDGTFEFPSVIPGTYRLSGTLPGGAWMRSAILGGRDVLDGTITVGASDVTGLVVTRSDRHTAIAGTLSGASGRPATAYFVIAFPAERTLWRTASRRVQSTRPSTAGAFELKDLPPGTYLLAVLTDLDGPDLQDPAFLESIAPAAVSVTLGDGERKLQDLRIR